MQSIRTKLGEGGRVIIPAQIRHNLNLEAGADIILHTQDDIIYITTPSKSLRKLQNKVKDSLKTSSNNPKSLVDELLIMRKVEEFDES
jgi:AbrB family looped-hinge helix DNA binding protein